MDRVVHTIEVFFRATRELDTASWRLLAANLIQLRRARGLAPRQLAFGCDRERCYIRAIEHAQAGISPGTSSRIQAALDCGSGEIRPALEVSIGHLIVRVKKRANPESGASAFGYCGVNEDARDEKAQSAESLDTVVIVLQCEETAEGKRVHTAWACEALPVCGQLCWRH